MIKQKIFLEKLTWTVYILYNVNCDDNTVIVKYLQYMNCSPYLINEALSNLNTCHSDIGFTYTNRLLRTSILVLSNYTSTVDLINTVSHELHHLMKQLQRFNSINEENLSEICGYLGENIYNVLKFIIK